MGVMFFKFVPPQNPLVQSILVENYIMREESRPIQPPA